MTTENPDSLITVKNSLIAQSNSCSTPKNSLSGFLGNFLVSHCGSLPIFYCFPAWQGLTMKIPCIFPANRELALETGSLVTADRRWQAGLCRNRRAALREIDWRCSEGSRAADSPEGWVLARTRYDAMASFRLRKTNRRTIGATRKRCCAKHTVGRSASAKAWAWAIRSKVLWAGLKTFYGCHQFFSDEEIVREVYIATR
jgi:hypothetical protein